MRIKDIDFWRKSHSAAAEAMDAWRVVPRLLVSGYAYLLYKVVDWYMNLKPYIPEEFLTLLEQVNSDPEMVAAIGSLMVMEPTTQHSFLVSTVVGISAAVFAMYTSSGKTWNGFTHWGTASKTKPDDVAVDTVDMVDIGDCEEIPIPKHPTLPKSPAE